MNEKDFNQKIIDLLMENLSDFEIEDFVYVETFEERGYLTKDVGFVLGFKNEQFSVRVKKEL